MCTTDQARPGRILPGLFDLRWFASWILFFSNFKYNYIQSLSWKLDKVSWLNSCLIYSTTRKQIKMGEDFDG